MNNQQRYDNLDEKGKKYFKYLLDRNGSMATNYQKLTHKQILDEVDRQAKKTSSDFASIASRPVVKWKETLKAHCGCEECKKDFEGVEKFKRRFKKVVTNKKTGRKKTVKYGQAGKAKDGGDRIRPNTSKGDAYCARSNKIKGDWRKDPNSPNNLSRKKWKCHGNKSSK